MKFFKKNDIKVIATILLIYISLWAVYNFSFDRNLAKAEIYYYSKLIQTVRLDEGIDQTFSIPQKPNVVMHLYQDGKICFEESDCPDKVCINTGKLSKVGQYAACLPNGIVIK